MSYVSVSQTSTSSEENVANAFKAAMRRFAVSVSIITISNDEAKFGMTATAVSSVSIDPPALLVCVNRSARLHGDMSPGKAFCVNMLNKDQAALSSAFGGRLPADERFLCGAWQAQDDCPPYLSDAQANVFCTVDVIFEYGTHTIFVGKVESVHLNGELRPLVYADGRYFSIAPAPESAGSIPPDLDLTWL